MNTIEQTVTITIMPLPSLLLLRRCFHEHYSILSWQTKEM